VTSVSLTTSASPSTYGVAPTFTATVQTNGIAVGSISGETITFYDGGIPLGQEPWTAPARPRSPERHPAVRHHPLDHRRLPRDFAYASSTNSPALSQTIAQATLTRG